MGWCRSIPVSSTAIFTFLPLVTDMAASRSIVLRIHWRADPLTLDPMLHDPPILHDPPMLHGVLPAPGVLRIAFGSATAIRFCGSLSKRATTWSTEVQVSIARRYIGRSSI